MDDRLSDPPHGIRDELDVFLWIKAACRLQQTDVAFTDQILERKSASAVSFGVGYNKPDVRLYEAVEGISVAATNFAAKLLFFIRCDSWQMRYAL